MLCQDPSHQLVLSVASVWEMEIKIQLGKLQFVNPLPEMIAEQQQVNRLEALDGDRRGQHSIRINDQWRICFAWREDNAYEVEITDSSW